MAVRKTMSDVLIAKGRKQDKKQGSIETCRKTLLRQLAKRFHEVPSEVEATVKATKDLAQLEEWLDRFATAKKLEDVGIPGVS